LLQAALRPEPDGLLIPNLLQPRDSGRLFCSAVQPLFQRSETTNPKFKDLEQGAQVQVLVRDNNVDQALKALKKKMQREGIFREMKLRGHFEKPSEKKAREKAEAIRRARKLARKKLQREGLLPMKPKPAFGRGATGGRPGAGGARPAGTGGGFGGNTGFGGGR
jgi:small subunit ribosomal protein S21